MTALVEAYEAWVAEMSSRRRPTEWVMRMIVDGMPPAEVDWRSRHPGG